MASLPLADKDYFTDKDVLLDPYEYFESLRASGPVHRMKARDIVVVTGHQEGVEVLLDTHNFSSILNPDPLEKNLQTFVDLQARFADRLPGCRRAEIAAGHQCMNTRPAELAAILEGMAR